MDDAGEQETFGRRHPRLMAGIAALAVAVAVAAAVGPWNGAAAPSEPSDGPIPGQLVVVADDPSASPQPSDLDDRYVRDARFLAGRAMEPDLDDEDLVVLGRRICVHLERWSVRTTRQYVRLYRSQRKELGVPVNNRWLVMGAAIAEAAPAAFCPGHEGAVSTDEAARMVGYTM